MDLNMTKLNVFITVQNFDNTTTSTNNGNISQITRAIKVISMSKERY
jgi:hypothetical protein